MGMVVRLSDFRKPGKALQGHAPARDPEPAYYCMCCDGDLFKMFPTGRVKCTHCGALIGNIRVKESTNHV